MPRYNIWVREADNDKWLAIKDKPQFLSDALNANSFIMEIKDAKVIEMDQKRAVIDQEIVFGNNPYRSVIDPTYTDPEDVA